MILKAFAIILIVTTISFAQPRSFKQIIHENKINLETKTIKSWLRLFNSQEKIQKYGYTMSETERYIVLKNLKQRQTETLGKYSRRLR